MLEFGTFVEDRQQSQSVDFINDIFNGLTNMELKDKYPTMYVQIGVDKIEKFRQDKLRSEHGNKFRDIKVTYIYGKARLGKTTYVYDKYPIDEICRVTNYKTGTFENYQSQKVLVLDEFTGKLELPFLNNLLDKPPLDLPARFANRTACFTEVYIISNLTLQDLYKDEQQTTKGVYDAFTERIHEIIKFTALGVYHHEKPKPIEPQQMELIPIENDDDLPF